MDSDAVRAFVDSLSGQRIGGRYMVTRVLGAGGMGVVVAARYPELDQDVAIKFLLPRHATNAVLAARFLREARVAARVKCPHFVRVFDVGRLDSDVPYLVMEMLSGRDLSEELDARGPLPVEDAIDYILQASVGIAEIHALGIVHRDLKPSNLFLSEAAGSSLVKVLDFGIAKENGDPKSALTATEHTIGTPQYMSPEQIRQSKNVDVRSDIWSLGVVLYQLLTTEHPFVAPDGAIGELFGLILHTDPILPTKHRPDLPPELEKVILTCLARERSARFSNVLEFAEALRPFAQGGVSQRIEVVRKALTSLPSEKVSEYGATESPSGMPPSTPSGRNRAFDRSGPATSMTATRLAPEVPLPLQKSRRSWKTVATAVVGGGAALALSRRDTPAPKSDTAAISAAAGASVLVSAAKDIEPKADVLPSAMPTLEPIVESLAPSASKAGAATPAPTAPKITKPIGAAFARPAPSPSHKAPVAAPTSTGDFPLDRK